MPARASLTSQEAFVKLTVLKVIVSQFVLDLDTRNVVLMN